MITVQCGNKLDLKREVSRSEGEEYAFKRKLAFIEISAKKNINIEKAFTQLVRMVREANIEWDVLCKKLEKGEDLVMRCEDNKIKCIVQ